MSLANQLKLVLTSQKEVTAKLEKEIQNLEKNDLVSENETLKKELTACKKLLDVERGRAEQSTIENKNLQNALYEQMYNEKSSILSAMNKKMNIYFKSEIQGELNRLIQFEHSTQNSIREMMKILQQNRVNATDEIYKSLAELKVLLNQKVTLAKEEIAKQQGTISKNQEEAFQKLHNERISEEDMKGIMKKNNIESLIGLNVINKLGILFLIIGVIAAFQFTYFQLPDIFKGIFSFAGGAILLVIGELMCRKRANVFSQGLTSAGIAVLYVALALSYFNLNILSMYPSLGLCILITAGAFLLSKRYNSQTIAAFALIGGYLPILSIAGNMTLVYSAMVYFVILNLLSFMMSINRKWMVSIFIGFILNVSATIYIMNIILSVRDSNAQFSSLDAILLLYTLFTFIVYTLIPIWSTTAKKTNFQKLDIALLGLNTVVSALLMYGIFYAVSLSDFTGILAVIFALVYLSLGRFIETRLPEEKNVRVLFYITGLTFMVLIIPFQFGKVWLSLGWLIEGVALVVYGALKENKSFQRAGFAICYLCFVAFMFFDVLFGNGNLFGYKYFAVTLGSLLILAAYMVKKSLASTGFEGYKYGVTINLWIFMMYMIGVKLNHIIASSLEENNLSHGYIICSLMIVVSFCLAYLIPRIRILLDGVMKVISFGIYSIAMSALFVINFSSPVVIGNTEIPLSISIVGMLILIMISLLSILALRDLVLFLVVDRKLGIEWYPLFISAYFVIILTQNLITQAHLEFTNAAISIIYVITALSWIIYGFIKRFAFIRRFGLGLSIMAVAKLFVVDFYFLTQGYKIISYFAFGVTLIAISFVYQYYSKRLEVVAQVIPSQNGEN